MKLIAGPKNCTFLLELTFANATKSNISQFQTFTNLLKNREIMKLCFAKGSYFKVICNANKLTGFYLVQ